ncbi:hypothetical protein [Streptomyces sp. NPDC057686]|uniref:hypothetical protein n=1 Tax=Streptomyces sp. NPDC057686 TaxID=3346212 RepID=UPI0036745CA7
MKIIETAVLAWREPFSRVYMAVLAVCALWAVAGGIGLGEEWRLPRLLAVILTMPWFLVVHLFFVVTNADWALLGYSFYFDSPAWLFEPVFIVYCLTAGLINAHLFARWSRAAYRPWSVPLYTTLFFVLVLIVWHL